MESISRVCVVVLSLTLLRVSDGLSQDWSSLRGPQFDGSASGDVSDLASGPLQLKLIWKKPLGSGYSSAVKSGSRIVTAMADVQAEKEFIVAMAADSGEILWQSPTGDVYPGANGSFDGPIATPAIDNERAYHLSPFGDLAAFRLEDGERVWSLNLKTEFSTEPNFYGFGASPIIHAGVLIVPVGSPDGAVMGFDPASGEVIWKAGKDTAAFQSPVPVTIEGQSVVLVACDTTLLALDPKTGEVHWSQPHGGASGMPAWAVVPVPISGGGVFLGDRRDGSTVIDLESDGATNRWSGREIRNSYCVPVSSGGLLCSYSSRFLTAVDPENGERLWRSRSPGNGFLGTIAGRLVVITMDGSLHVGDVSEEGFEEVVATQVFESGDRGSEGLVWSLPAIAGRSIYLRSLGSIARIDIKSGSGEESVASVESELAPSFERFIDGLAMTEDKDAAIDRFLADHATPIVDDDHVHFVLRGEHKDVAVASDLFGVRQERPMLRVPGTDFFYFGVRLQEPTRASYVFFADYVPKVDPGNAQRVLSTTLTGEMEPSFMGPAEPLQMSWFDTTEDSIDSSIDQPAELTGTLQELKLESRHMKEAIQLSIYLPAEYADPQKKSKRYPVVFVHDGQAALDSGNQAAIADNLIRERKIPPVVIVFIKKRFHLLQGATGYGEMFADELIPMIEGSFRVSSDRQDRASLGGGFGAFLALMGTLPASDSIGRIGCHAPFAFEMLYPAVQGLATLPNDRCQILVQSGRYEFRNPSENWNMAEQAQVVADMLRKGGHRLTTEVVSTGSDWVCWRKQSARMWQFLLGI